MSQVESSGKETSNADDKVVERGKRQLLIAPRRGINALRAGVAPMSASAMKGMLATLPGVDVVRVLKPKKHVQAMSIGADDATDVYVVRLDKDRAELLKQTAPPSMIVEEDAYLDYGVVRPMRRTPEMAPSSAAAMAMQSQAISFRVVNEANAPLPGVRVTLTGDTFPSEATTDESGEVLLDLATLPGGRARTLYIKPSRDYWDRFVTAPELSTTEVNVVRLWSLDRSLAGFPGQYKHGWGQRAMGLGAMPAHVTGKGIKIAIIDSGADSSHPLLGHVSSGVDFTNGADKQTWSADSVGHGSHCAGVICARATSNIALTGFAPEAEIHVFKVFPGGQFSSLLEALDECMARDIDVVNMSLGSAQFSAAVEQKLEECVLDGVACIVAAGNSGDNVQYPASSPNVLAVAAIGKLKEFPSEAWDMQTVMPGQVTSDGIFSPSFTCFGPQIGVCAPGVAIVSTVPGAGFEPQSGTSMAAPHVTGVAALLLAHHPLFQSTLRARGPQRVAALFNTIRSICRPLPLSPERTGVGVPDLEPLAAVLQPAVGSVRQRAAQAPQPSAPGAAAAPNVPPPPEGAPAAATQLLQGLTPQQLEAAIQQLLLNQALYAAAQAAAGSQGTGVPGTIPMARNQAGGLPFGHPVFWSR